jgi:hypothetical protein
MVTPLVGYALDASNVDAARREHQLEVYRVSSYLEHHLARPSLPGGFRNG